MALAMSASMPVALTARTSYLSAQELPRVVSELNACSKTIGAKRMSAWLLALPPAP